MRYFSTLLIACRDNNDEGCLYGTFQRSNERAKIIIMKDVCAVLVSAP